MEGKINIDDLITHTMPLDRINDAFDLMAGLRRLPDEVLATSAAACPQGDLA